MSSLVLVHGLLIFCSVQPSGRMGGLCLHVVKMGYVRETLKGSSTGDRHRPGLTDSHSVEDSVSNPLVMSLEEIQCRHAAGKYGKVAFGVDSLGSSSSGHTQESIGDISRSNCNTSFMESAEIVVLL